MDVVLADAEMSLYLCLTHYFSSWLIPINYTRAQLYFYLVKQLSIWGILDVVVAAKRLVIVILKATKYYIMVLLYTSYDTSNLVPQWPDVDLHN